MSAADGHVYVSTACHHERHYDCRKTCKFCAVRCSCSCHHKRSVTTRPSVETEHAPGGRT